MEQGASRPARAAVLVVSGMALFGLIDNFMRLAAEEGGLWQFHFLRAAVALGVLGPVAWMAGAGPCPSGRGGCSCGRC